MAALIAGLKSCHFNPAVLQSEILQFIEAPLWK
jgi:hypothetical protein